MRAHVIKNGKVTNTIEVASLDFMPGLIEATAGSIGDLWDGTTFSKPARYMVVEAADFILQVDTDTDALIKAAVGERLNEYNLAEKEALAYKAAGYTGTVPTSVSSWATVKGWTATQAADSILSAAEILLSAQQAIRANRLLAKETARTATDIAELDTIKATWGGFLAAIKAQLGV
jgi:hypothetical protein